MAADEEILCKECGKKLQIYELNLTEKIRLCPTDGVCKACSFSFTNTVLSINKFTPTTFYKNSIVF